MVANNRERIEQIKEVVTEEPLSQSRIFYSAAVILGLLVIGAVAFHTIEGWTWIDSVYFAVVSGVHESGLTGDVFTASIRGGIRALASIESLFVR